MSGRMVNSRVSVTEETRDELKDFANGLGVTYDEAIKLLLGMVRQGNEELIVSGRRLRTSIKKSSKE